MSERSTEKDYTLRAALEALIARGDTRTLDDIDEPAVLIDDLRELLAETETAQRRLIHALHAERAAGGTTHIDCWACEAARSPFILALLDGLPPGWVIDHAMLVAIKALREEAAGERVAMHERGEPLTDYSAGVLDGLDKAWLAARRAARRPADDRETTSIEEWWACEDAYDAGRVSELRQSPGERP